MKHFYSYFFVVSLFFLATLTHAAKAQEPECPTVGELCTNGKMCVAAHCNTTENGTTTESDTTLCRGSNFCAPGSTEDDPCENGGSCKALGAGESSQGSDISMTCLYSLLVCVPKSIGAIDGGADAGVTRDVDASVDGGKHNESPDHDGSTDTSHDAEVQAPDGAVDHGGAIDSGSVEDAGSVNGVPDAGADPDTRDEMTSNSEGCSIGVTPGSSRSLLVLFLVYGAVVWRRSRAVSSQA